MNIANGPMVSFVMKLPGKDDKLTEHKGFTLTPRTEICGES